MPIARVGKGLHEHWAGGEGNYMPTLFDPVRIGAWNLPNRIVMAPLTRARAGVEACSQRLDGRILRPACFSGLDHFRGDVGHAHGRGLCRHAGHLVGGASGGLEARDGSGSRCRGRILLQLWHVGRISDPMFLNGALPVAPSADCRRGERQLRTSPETFRHAARAGIERDSRRH